MMKALAILRSGRTSSSRCIFPFGKLHHCYYFSTNQSYPYHIVVGMPALSPTMDRGTLASWNVQAGSRFQAGDALAKIETDKASIDFEAQDDGWVAKLLVPEGTPDITVGTPIVVTVEEEEHVAAFRDFVLEDDATTTTTTATTSTASPPAAAVPTAPTKPTSAAAPPMVAPAPPPITAPVPVVATAAPLMVTPSPPPTIAVALPPQPPSTTAVALWGATVHRSSPIAMTLSALQKAYIEKYGTTGQIPI